ncbi:GDSL lipase/esterase - like 10 [Theobroma cacao]|nr:GDSL lipase/esterase - like 10 [Theobroma cacao]
MASKLKLFWMLPVSFLLLSNCLHNGANAAPQVPCYFIFGDSLSDNGNNNNLKTLAKVNYLPYGIDFPEGPTGRFSNDRNMQDVIVEYLGFQNYMPPFARAQGRSILKGVNYASGSAGIRDESGKQLVCVCVYIYIYIFQKHSLLAQSVSIFLSFTLTKETSFLSNDYINNYFVPEFYNTSRQYTPEQYAAVLVEQYSHQIKVLYGHGARKFALYGIGLIGCTPYAISVYGTNGSPCVDKLNTNATLFNERLMPLVKELNTNLTDAKFTYLNPSPSPQDVLSFVTNSTCCEVGGGGGELCVRNSKPCSDRSRFVFWDAVHPTDAWNELLAESAYRTNSTSEAHPFNIQTLAKLK